MVFDNDEIEINILRHLILKCLNIRKQYFQQRKYLIKYNIQYFLYYP